MNNLYLVKGISKPDEKILFSHEGFFDEEMQIKDYLKGLDLMVKNDAVKNYIYLTPEKVKELHEKLGEWLKK